MGSKNEGKREKLRERKTNRQKLIEGGKGERWIETAWQRDR
jgi:hypothetical protein